MNRRVRNRTHGGVRGREINLYFPPTRLYEERLRLCSDYEANSEKKAFIEAKLEEQGVKELTEEEGFEPLDGANPFLA